MKHKLIAILLAFCLLFTVSSAAYAASETGKLTIYDGNGNIVKYVDTFEAAFESIENSSYTLELNDDISTQLISTAYGTAYQGVNLSCNLDLNGHALTITGNISSESSVLMVCGLYMNASNTTVSNGSIILSFSSPTPTEGDGGITMPLYTTGVFIAGEGCTLKNVSIETEETETRIAGITYADQELRPDAQVASNIDNVTIDVTGNAFSYYSLAGYDNKATVQVNSGSFSGLNKDALPTNLTLNASSNVVSGISDVDEGTTVITSNVTTAIIVDDGNAFLYNTLQDAVNAASLRADGSGNVKIQLLKQPTGEVELPADVHAENITITELSSSGGIEPSIDFSKIQMTDSNGNTVTVGSDGALDTTIAVQSVTLDNTALELYVGSSATLTATVTPDDADDKEVTWSSNAPAIATVDENGNVKALRPGTATITATAGGQSDTCIVTVSYPVTIPDTYDIEVIPSDNGTVRPSLSNASAGSTITLTVTPDEGYELAYITVDGERIDGTSFTMPAHDVEVRAYFVRIGADMPFTDVNSGDWFYDYVAYVYANGLMDGTSATTFEPNGTMTRAMVWAILARVDGETITGASWAEAARTWAMANGVSDGTAPNGLVTREQFATMLYRYAGSTAVTGSLSAYTDAARVNDWARDAMTWAVANGIINGATATTLDPQGTATRAQCAAMLMRFVEL